MVKSPYQDDALRLLLQKVTLPVITAGFETVGADWKCEPHVASAGRMYWILDGEGWVEVDGCRYYPPPGSLVIMPRGATHAYSAISANTFTMYWCRFKAKLGDTDSDLFRLYSFPVFLKMKDKARVTKLFEQLHYHFWHRRPTSPFMLKAAMFEIMSMYLDQAMNEDLPIVPEQPDTIKRIIRYIEQNLSRRIAIKELAQLAHYHPNYFIRYFRSTLGASPAQYIRHLRMEKAKTLLLSTSLPVARIAEQVGFQHSKFTTMFKQHTGFSPNEFREMAKSDQPRK